MFLKLGCTCFGGPAAHIGYFREEFVERRRWLGEVTLGEFIGLTQLLPGPSSSQTSFLIGVSRAGIPGGVAAWLGFTLPSAMLMILFAAGVRQVHGRVALGALHGLQVAAVAVIANAVISMFRRLCPDLTRAAIAVLAAAFVLFFAGSVSQIGVVIVGGVVGWFLLPEASIQGWSENLLLVSHRAAAISLALFAAVFLLLQFQPPLLLAFYRTGSLVFGGGHVVLPLLEQSVVRPGWINENDFLDGYGAVQALPGPLFTFAAYLGYVARVSPNGLPGALLCLVAIFLPGLLLALAAAPFWQRLRNFRRARSLLAGVNAAVVGLLISALVHAAVSGALRNYFDGALAAAGLLLLARTRLSPVIVVLATSLISAAFTVIS